MRIREISVEAKVSKNYQTYTVGAIATIDEGEDAAEVTKGLQRRVRLLAREQLEEK